MKYDFIEIGTSDFDTLLETTINKIGISIEPLKYYLDNLPNNDKVIKVNCAIEDIDDFDNVKKLTVILNGKIRDEYDFTVNRETFKQVSYREIKKR